MNAYTDTDHQLPAALGWARHFTRLLGTRHFIVRTPEGSYYSPNDGDLAWSWGDEEYSIVARVDTDGKLTLRPLG